MSLKTEIDSINILCSGTAGFDEMARLKTYKPFSEIILQFFNDLSAGIFRDVSYREYRDIASFAFFIRKSNLLKMKAELLTDKHIRLGRGLTFHIAPSNVPVNFAYSLAAGLLSGNPCIIKVSSKDFPQIRLLCATIAELLKNEQYKELADYIAVVQYDNKKEINDYFSSICQTRLIWGGDQTIAEIRKSPLPPRSFDVTFANRYSFCLINAAAYLDLADKKGLAIDFYNDTYAFDQNACFSPRLIYWVGGTEEANGAKKIFWEHLYNYARGIYSIDDFVAVEKHMSLNRIILANQGINVVKSADNLITRCEAKEISEKIFDSSSSGGFFIEYTAGSLDDLDLISSKKTQTLSCYGYDIKELADHIAEHGLYGIDRITEIGKSHEFSLIWDGINLITALTRVIDRL